MFVDGPRVSRLKYMFSKDEFWDLKIYKGNDFKHTYLILDANHPYL